MPTKTANYQLNLLQPTDLVQDSLVTSLGQNSTIIDAALAGLQTQVDSNAGLGDMALDIFVTGFVVGGLLASADTTNANQLDVSAGVAYLLQADGSLSRVTPVAATFSTSLASATYYLDLQANGTYSWGNTHSTQNNYLAIAQVTSASNGSINVVTDKRPMTPGQGAVNAEWLNGEQSSAFTPVAHVGSGGAAHAAATETTAGFISAADKLALDQAVASAGVLTNLMTPDSSSTVNGINSTLYGYSTYKTNADVNGLYTTVTYKRTNGTVYLVSTLSGGTSPNYTIMTWNFYNAAGTSIVLTHTWTFTYDGNGHILSQVVS
jgi:hypothetical protein